MLEAEKLLVNSLKMAYLAGKGRHVVSVIIPKDTVKAIKYQARPDIREMSSVSKENLFLFASTKLSDVQFTGWHAFNEICCKSDLEKP